MKADTFARYCRINKIARIVPSSSSIQFHFYNGKRIDAYTTYDGIEYKRYKKPKPNANKKLFQDLQETMPRFLKDIYERYSQ